MQSSLDKIEKFITKNKEDNFLNHLITFITIDYRILGKRKNNLVLIWQQTIWLRLFYPIFIFEIDNESNLIIKDKINLFGKIMTALFILAFFFLFFPKNIYDIKIANDWKSLLIFFLLFTSGTFLFRLAYRFEKENQLNEILSLLKIDSKPFTIENTWSIKNILIRFICYPFSFFIIYIGILSIYQPISYKSIFAGIGSISAAIMFLYADTKIIFRNKNREASVIKSDKL
jgi:hypothetical protein